MSNADLNDANIAEHVEIASFHAANEGDAYIPEQDGYVDMARIEAEQARYSREEWPDPIEAD